jgi:ubiquinone/menaquinone biosynthesis C-methylase UbiE
MAEHVCPWWGGYFIDNPLRRLLHNPEKILGLYVKPGMTAVDIGCGMGFCSIAMARMVGGDGKVIAVDLQQKMLDVLLKRARKADVAERIETHRCDADNLGVDTAVDFGLAFMMVHEVPDTKRLLQQVQGCLKPGGRFFVAEPRIHVPAAQFEAMVKTAEEVGLKVSEQPHVRWCRAAVFARQ